MALKSKDVEQVRPTVPVAAAAQGEIVRVNMNVSRAKRDNWKMAAIKKQMSLSDMIDEAVSKYLAE